MAGSDVPSSAMVLCPPEGHFDHPMLQAHPLPSNVDEFRDDALGVWDEIERSFEVEEATEQDYIHLGDLRNRCDGSTQAYKRLHHPKSYCLHCEDHPDGFRGDHELQRHVARAHSNSREVCICVDKSEGGKFLAGCKAYRTQKHYETDYSAAAQ
jgi:hypothetical protein